jgi:hypothetical protein
VLCIAGWLACCLGCGAATTPAPARPVDPRLRGDPDAPPTLNALPELPAGASGVTERTHQGILVARQALDATLPAPPADRSFASLKLWADTQVASWIDARAAQMDTARARFLHEGKKPSAGEAILSHAVLALLQEDTARSLATIPAPTELDSEQEIAAMYRELMAGQADAFVAAALLELRDCANLAYRGPDDMRAFAEYCHARFDRLQGEVRARKGESEPAAAKHVRPQYSAQ